jgi:hypothetical protein
VRFFPDVRLHETSHADRATRQQQGVTRLVLRAIRLQILDIEFTHSQTPEEDRAFESQTLNPAVVLEPGILAQWINHTKPSLLQLAVAVTSARNPIVNEAQLVETILVHARGASKLNKLWLHNVDLDLPTIQGAPVGSFPLMAASLKPRKVSQLFIEHFLAQSPKLFFMNVDLSTEEQDLTFTSESLQRLAVTVLKGTRVNSITFHIPTLLRANIQSPYPFSALRMPLSTKLAHLKLQIFSPGPDVEDAFRLHLPAELPHIEGATFHLPNMSWSRAKAMIGHASSLKHATFTRSMDSVLSRTDMGVEEIVTTFPHLVSLYLGEAIFSDMIGTGAVENWLGGSKWEQLQVLRVATTTTSRDLVTGISKLLRKCPDLVALEIARPYGCEEDRVTAAVAGGFSVQIPGVVSSFCCGRMS